MYHEYNPESECSLRTDKNASMQGMVGGLLVFDVVKEIETVHGPSSHSAADRVCNTETEPFPGPACSCFSEVFDAETSLLQPLLAWTEAGEKVRGACRRLCLCSCQISLAAEPV